MPDPVKKKKKVQKKPSNMQGRGGGVTKNTAIKGTRANTQKAAKKTKKEQEGYGPQNRIGIAPKKRKIVRRGPQKQPADRKKRATKIINSNEKQRLKLKEAKRKIALKKKGASTTGPKKKMSGGARAALKIAKAKVMQNKKGGGSSRPTLKKRANKAMVDKKILAARSAYQKKHGSNSGGTDAQFKAYQANLNKIRKGY